MKNIRQNIDILTICCSKNVYCFAICHYIFRIVNVILFKDSGLANSIYTPLFICMNAYTTNNVLTYQSLLVLICLYFKLDILRYLVILGTIKYIDDNNVNNIFVTLISLFSNNIDVLFLNTLPFSNYFFIWYLNDVMSDYNYWRLVIITYILRHECYLNKYILWSLMIGIAYYKNFYTLAV